ncbi:MAG: hypothetical protein NVS4B2_35440 [Chloroflexota bacterium]
MTDGFGAKSMLSLTADCDSQSNRVHILMHGHDSSGKPVDAEIIVIKKKVWVRARSELGAWSTWKPVEGDGQMFLIYLLPQSCPQSGMGRKKFTPAPYLENLGSTLVDGVATWHLRSHTRSQRTRVVVNLYVDQTTYFWRRWAVSQIAAKKRNTLIEDARYSRFNEPITIKAPIAASSAIQLHAIHQPARHGGTGDVVRSPISRLSGSLRSFSNTWTSRHTR